MKKTELEIKVDSFRRIPNPYRGDANNSPQMFTAICDVKDVPEELLNWMKTNPRKQNIRSGVAKKIKESLLTGQDFHLLNRGLLLSADDVRYSNYENKMTISFSDPDVHGDVDGGHTLRIILDNRENVGYGEQYVKIEILTGVESIFEDLAAARNTSTQVQDKSIANLRNYFGLIKKVIAKEKFAKRVYFMENDDGDIDVGDILAILNLFNIDQYHEMDSFPVVSFSSRKKCIDTYIKAYVDGGEDPDCPSNPYVKMKPVMLQIFQLYDKLESKMADYYKAKNATGKYGAISGVTTLTDSMTSRGKTFTTKFYEYPQKHLSPNGFLFPILGSLRALLEEKDGVYHWIEDPFKMLDEVGPDLVYTVVDRSRTLGNNPAQVGKDSGTWQTLYMRVKFQAISKKK